MALELLPLLNGCRCMAPGRASIMKEIHTLNLLNFPGYLKTVWFNLGYPLKIY